MKKQLTKMFAFLLILFSVVPSDASASTSDGRRLDEVLGSYAMSLVGKVEEQTDHYGTVAKEMGQKVLEHFKGRENELNKIVGGALGTDGQLPLWDDIVEFTFPVEQESVNITATPALKGSISLAVVQMPKEIALDDGWTRLEGSVADNDPLINNDAYKYLYPNITVPAGWTFILAADYSLTRQSYAGYENNNSYAPSVSMSTRKGEKANRSYVSKISYVQGETISGTLISELKPVSSAYTIDELYFNVTTHHASLGQLYNWRYRLYQDVPPAGGSIDVTNYLKNNYVNNSSNDNYDIINGQVGDNTTVTYYFNQTYETFNDYGKSPDEIAPTPEQGILGKITDFMSGLGDLIGKLWEGLFNIIERLVALFIPTSEQVADMGNSLTNISETFREKFGGVLNIGESFTGVFASPRSMVGMTVQTEMGTIELIPASLQGAISTLRELLSGTAVVMTGIYIYKRIFGSGDVIQS